MKITLTYCCVTPPFRPYFYFFTSPLVDCRLKQLNGRPERTGEEDAIGYWESSSRPGQEIADRSLEEHE